MTELLEPILLHPRLWMSLHILGVCVGLGGATIADVLFFAFLKDFRISKKEAEILRTLSHVILGALLLILLSGVALYLPDVAKYNASPAFIAKMTIVVALTINGTFLHEYISPKLVRMSFTQNYRTTPGLRQLRHLAFALGAVSASSWYFVFFLAMLKSLLPAAMPIQHILGAYVAIVCTAMCFSQYIEYRLHLRGARGAIQR
jgi:uncharacterized membrane protein